MGIRNGIYKETFTESQGRKNYAVIEPDYLDKFILNDFSHTEAKYLRKVYLAGDIKMNTILRRKKMNARFRELVTKHSLLN